jgi:uncharacterized protein YggE
MRTHFMMLAAFLGLCSPALAQADRPQIRVTGRATVSAQPEQASVDVGVVTEAPEAKDAARLNAEKLDSVLTAIRNALGAGAKFETVSYSLNPVYRHPEPRREPVLTGYSATNVVRVKDLALDKVGEVIDLATSSGANSVSNIAFGLRDEPDIVRPMPMYRAEMAMAQGAAPPTPIEAGAIEVRASVTLVVLITP